MKEKQIGNMIELSPADPVGWIHCIGSDTYVKRLLVTADAVSDYEEVTQKPAYTKAEYDARVNDLIRQRYSESEEFAILRQRDIKPTEYSAYYAHCEECKELAKVEFTKESQTKQEQSELNDEKDFE